MTWEVEYTDEFEDWWHTLSESEQEDVAASVELLELRIQHAGDPYRVLCAFDPRRAAILLIGGNKTGDKDWYDKYIPIADRLYDEHLAILRKENSVW
jgi:hypothetical protein